jgi:hypothetical protein
MARSVAAQQLQLETLVLEPPAHTGSRKPVSASDNGKASDTVNDSASGRAVHRPSPAELLETPGALLTRSDLRGLELERRAIDAVFRALPVVALPGYSRPLIRAEQYVELVEEHTYRDDRVRPSHAT